MEVTQFLKNFESTFLQSLYELDEIEAQRVQGCGCGHCGAKLDCGDYWRSLRGLEVEERKHKRRFSFCCRKCRRRMTPVSVRFLGRKVYLGIVVVLMSYLRQRREVVAMKRLVDLSGARGVTIRRWLHWWQEAVRGSAFWKASRGLFKTPLVEERLLCSLYEQFRNLSESVDEALGKLLNFLRPITNPSQYPS